METEMDMYTAVAIAEGMQLQAAQFSPGYRDRWQEQVVLLKDRLARATRQLFGNAWAAVAGEIRLFLRVFLVFRKIFPAC